MALDFFVSFEIRDLTRIVACISFQDFHITCLHWFSWNNLLISWDQRTIRTFNHRTIRSSPWESKSKASNFCIVFIIRTSIEFQRFHRAIVITVACVISSADIKLGNFQLFLHIHYNPIGQRRNITCILAVPECGTIIAEQTRITTSITAFYTVAGSRPTCPVVLQVFLSGIFLQ